MSALSLIDLAVGRSAFDADCRIDLEHTVDSLHAHLDFEGDEEIGAGDQVTVHGEPINLAYGEKLVVERRVTVVRAGWFDRIWARVAGGLEVTELYDVSFTSRRNA